MAQITVHPLRGHLKTGQWGTPSKPANGIEAGQKHLYPAADGGDKKKVHIRRILA
jgi:hypothetical protein